MEQTTKGKTMKLATPEIIMMDEAEAYLRTVTDRLWEHRKFMKDNLLAWESLSQYIDEMAEGWWRLGYSNNVTKQRMAQNVLEGIESLLNNWDVPTASPIGHLIGYNQY